MRQHLNSDLIIGKSFSEMAFTELEIQNSLGEWDKGISIGWADFCKVPLKKYQKKCGGGSELSVRMCSKGNIWVDKTNRSICIQENLHT